MPMARRGIGIDIGGTFTDVVCVGDNATHVFKVPSTRSDPSRAVEKALKRLVEELAVPADAIERFCHGTTVATNAVIERKGARVGLVTTRGFRDILTLGRQLRRQMYDLQLRPETPDWLAPGARRAEVDERVAADGTVVEPLDDASVTAAVAQLLEQNVEVIAVCLLFSFINPAHEHAIRDHIAKVAPGLPVSLSSDVDPVFREYERTVATCFDAYVKPITARYLEAMADTIAADGVPAGLQVMQSRGGLASDRVARQRPVRLLLSGPAAGVRGGLATGLAAGFDNLITLDVGGTSSDIALVEHGQLVVRPDTSVDGLSVRVPSVDIETLGAGGGSIAWVDSGGGLRVGPHSAGAEPGPACYGNGGNDATVTDASLVLGYLDPGFFAGGRLSLDAARAAAAMDREVASPLGMTRIEAALGIHRVANAQMADGIRLVSVKRGLDAREFVLVPMGGGGGVHAVQLARELDMERVLVPRFPGVLSAAGLLAAPVEHEVSAAMHVNLGDASLDELGRVFAVLDARADELMRAERIAGLGGTRRHSVDMAYVGQSHLIEVQFNAEIQDPLGALYRGFEAAHERINGHAISAPAKIVNLRSVHQAHDDVAGLDAPLPTETGKSQKGVRAAHFPHEGEVETAVHDRALLALGEVLAGPAIIEQDDTTTLLPARWQALVLPSGALLLTRENSI